MQLEDADGDAAGYTVVWHGSRLLFDVGDWPCAVFVTDGVVLASVMTNPEADPRR